MKTIFYILVGMIFTILSGIGYVAIIITIVTLPTMWLWNWLMPEIFGLIKINFLQALGLLTLSSLLFSTKLYSEKPKTKNEDK